MPRKNILNTLDSTNVDSPLWRSKHKTCHIRIDIHNRNTELIDMMIRKHFKVFFIRMDLRFPDQYPVDVETACKMVSKFFDVYMQALVDHYGQKADFQYRRVLERNPGSSLPHVHSFLLANGKWVKSIYRPLKIAEEVWNTILGGHYQGLIDWCRQEEPKYGVAYSKQYHNNGIMLNRNSPHFQELLQDCRRWSSYLAKLEGKELFPPYTHVHDGSQFQDSLTSPHYSGSATGSPPHALQEQIPAAVIKGL